MAASAPVRLKPVAVMVLPVPTFLLAKKALLGTAVTRSLSNLLVLSCKVAAAVPSYTLLLASVTKAVTVKALGVTVRVPLLLLVP